MDRWAWAESAETLAIIRDAYDQYQFTKVFHQLDNFFSVTLSAGYFDILKDRLYTFDTHSAERRAAQTVLYDVLKYFVVAIAPVLSFTAEEIWQSLPDSFKNKEEKSVFLSLWPKTSDKREEALGQEWNDIFSVKRAVSKSLEGLRQAKTIGSSLEGEVDLYLGNEKVKTVLKNTWKIFVIISWFQMWY